jgi:hypothetical protein
MRRLGPQYVPVLAVFLRPARTGRWRLESAHSRRAVPQFGRRVRVVRGGASGSWLAVGEVAAALPVRARDAGRQPDHGEQERGQVIHLEGELVAVGGDGAPVLPGDLPATTTLSPRRARSRAAAPIPSLAPVTTTTLRSSDAVLMRQP